MKSKFYLLIALIVSCPAISQVPEDAVRLSWLTQTGTARSMATGGAMGSLGGDLTASLVNPAGLAFIKTNNILISPAIQFGKGSSTFRETDLSGKGVNRFALGTSGIVGNSDGITAGLSVTQRAAYNRPESYKGQNNYSSFGEPLGDEFAASQLTIDQALNSYDVSLSTKMALYTYLVDTATVNGQKQVIVRSETGLVNQEYSSTNKGGTTEITLGFAGELDKKWMFGVSFGLPITVIDRDIYYRETDATGNINNNFNYMAYREKYRLSGWGLNMRAGVIYRPREYIRLGFAIHSPDIMSLKEKYDAGFAADLEKLFDPNSGYDSVGAAVVNNGPVADTKYSIYTPLKVLFSASYVFREISDVSKQKAFITADVEYLNYAGNHFGPDFTKENADDRSYFSPFNKAIKAAYKGAFNLRIGGELKFNTIMARLGFASYGSPYKDVELKAPRMNISGGLGYRNKGIFIDLAYTHRLNKDVNFPYRVSSPRANTFAELRDNGGMVMLTFGSLF